MERGYNIILCDHCIEGIRVHGEMVYKGKEIDRREHEKVKCDWCEDEDVILYECIFG